jgi:hypothetical protein
VGSIVVLLVFISTAALVMPAGAVAPPYHLNHMRFLFLDLIIYYNNIKDIQ